MLYCPFKKIKTYYSSCKKLILVLLYFIFNRNYFSTVQESRKEWYLVDKNLEMVTEIVI